MPETLAAKHEKALDLNAELDRSLAIQAWMPDAFEHGQVKIQFAHTTCSRRLEREVIKFTAKVTLGNGEVRMFGHNDIPSQLWPSIDATKYIIATPRK